MLCEKLEHEYEKFEHTNIAREQEEKLDYDDLWLCAVCLWSENVGVFTKYAPCRNLNVCRLPRPPNKQTEQKNIFGNCQNRSKIAGTCWK